MHQPTKPTHQKYRIERMQNVWNEFDVEATGIADFRNRSTRHISLRMCMPLLDLATAVDC